MKIDVTAIGAALVDLVAVVERFPEIDDEVYVPQLQTKCGGSAANFSVACARLGLKSAFIGKLGSDAFGDRLIQDFKNENVNTDGIVFTDKIGTGICYAAVSGAERKLYAFSGAANILQPKEIRKEIITSSRLIHLASLKNIEPLEKAAEIAKELQIQVSLNPGALIADQGLKKIQRLISLTDIYISPQDELIKLMEVDSLQDALKTLFNIGPKIAAITLGSKGSLIADKKKEYKIPPYDVKPLDTTGAGDAFSAGFITGILNNQKLEICGKMGNAVAAIKIQHIGAREGLPTKDRLDKFLQSN
ncbi:MAG: carbohydrate kinase family protein [Promethearchaeota archaeon]